MTATELVSMAAWEPWLCSYSWLEYVFANASNVSAMYLKSFSVYY